MKKLDDNVDFGLTPPLSWNAKAVLVSIMMAARGLTANKFRSFLTVLGVVIGVAAVIIAIGIGEGSRAAVAASIQKLGTNVLTVMPGQQKNGAVSFGFGSASTLKLADAEAILAGAPHVARISPSAGKSLQVKYRDKNDNVSISGVGVDYAVINNTTLSGGRFFTDEENRGKKRVAVLGATTATDLFGDDSPVGQQISIAAQKFDVIGVFKAKGGMGPNNPDSSIYVPIATGMRRLFGVTSISTITAEAKSFSGMAQAQSEISDLLRKRHRLTGTAASDFIIFSQATLANATNEQQETFGSLITYLAIVSLGVGGIGIMNIMLVSVTERTREIGVRKAVGARRRDVLSQFLFEGLFLSAVGGVLGILVGYAGASLVSATKGWAVSVGSSSIVLAFGCSMAVGVFFGFYPALKAAKLKPIEALRFE